MPRLLLLVIFVFSLGMASPAPAAIYPGGKVVLFSGLAHTAFKRLDVPFPGWVQPDFRALTGDRDEFTKFLKEIRGFFQSNRLEKSADRQATASGETGNGLFDANSIFSIQIGGNAAIGNTMDIFIGVSLRRILTQVFAAVFQFKEEKFSHTKDQEMRLFGGAGSTLLPNRSDHYQTGLLAFDYNNSGISVSSPQPVFKARTKRATPPGAELFDEEEIFTFRAWRMRIASAMTNPVVIFCIVILSLVSFAWRVSRAKP